MSSDWSRNGEGKEEQAGARVPLGVVPGPLPAVSPPGITGLLRSTVASGHVASLATGPHKSAPTNR